MKVNLLYRTIISDTETGKVEKRSHWKRSRSFVLQFLQHLEVTMNHAYAANPTTVSAVNTSNVAKNIPYVTAGGQGVINHMSINAANADATYGFQVGTGATAPANSDYVMQTPIGNGSGGGQLNYGAHTFVDAVIVGGNVDFVMSRTFANASGGTINVTEIGIYCKTNDSTGNPFIFLIVHDVVTSTPVLNTKTLTVQYTFRTTV
jgi:hypothetical protein